MLNTVTDVNVTMDTVVPIAPCLNAQRKPMFLMDMVTNVDVIVLDVVSVITPLDFVNVSLDITVKCVKHKLH
jgi:hypothetical protein